LILKEEEQEVLIFKYFVTKTVVVCVSKHVEFCGQINYD